MPLYEYECDACGRRFEVIQKFSDPPVATCTECGSGPVHRLLSSPAIQFKGTGWYITDYAKKGTSDATTPAAKGDAAKSGTGTSSDTSAKPDASKSDTSKTDSSSASAPASKE